MSKSTIPDPRAVAVVADRTYRAIESDENRAYLLDDPDSLIVPYSAEPVAQVERVLSVREQLMLRDRMVTGQLLLRNPYDVSAYEFADDAIETFVKAKYYHLASLAAHLGASSIKFVKIDIDQNKFASSAGIRAHAKVVKADGKFNRDMKNRLEGRFEAETFLAGKEVDVEAARSFMVERHLANDPDVQGLIQLFATGNPVRRHKVKINGLRESARSLKAGLSLTTSLDIELDGAGNLSRASESISSIEVTTEISWPTK